MRGAYLSTGITFTLKKKENYVSMHCLICNEISFEIKICLKTNELMPMMCVKLQQTHFILTLVFPNCKQSR
jgi:hypothetical protein